MQFLHTSTTTKTYKFLTFADLFLRSLEHSSKVMLFEKLFRRVLLHIHTENATSQVLHLG